ncbi:mitochondria protein Fmp29 [Aspergillus vadensis CBS 113365]|uniref:Altered inheritance of mitochondria protein 9, mitochondrial n=1 Tax=Aspergillus vadensis (strain CBS 113365 / IMI 142717 / IBT 24658) TaxID=1448311 RepID=A0A319BJA3_ASPVC|nr:mitochondria protein Fmp29 [Aspergillus vadensis CBS 113365]PYH72717.1 mitochondria protein Fmp29 [Aspergillus vadensis CBS 113365]
MNEDERLKERYVKFDPIELQRVAGKAMGEDHCFHIIKLAEGGFNKVFLFRTTSGKEVIARIPAPIAGPPHYTTASEVATMSFLRDILGVPVPRVLAYSADSTNPVGSEYIIMERRKLKRGFLQDFCIGPIAARQFWHGDRSNTKIDRGLWLSPEDCFTSAARRETTCILQYAKPQPRRTFLLPTSFDIDPSELTSLLSEFLQLATLLVPKDTFHDALILRHPDLTLNNILLKPGSAKIASIIDCEEQMEAKAKCRSEEANLYYTAATGLYNGNHWSALKIPHLGMRQYLHQQTGYLWDGDVINLRAALVGITTPQVWDAITSERCPVVFSDQERHTAIEEANEWNECEELLDIIRND